MDGDSMKIVASGDRLSISAHGWNRVNRAVVRSERTSRSGGANPASIDIPEGLILVQNKSGADRSRFDVLGISGVIVAPNQNLLEFQNRPAVTGVIPTTASHTGKFCVLYEPIASNAVGRAFIFGLCTVQVNIASTSDTAADVSNADPTQLASGSSGAAQILYSPGSTGTQWCIVRFGGGGGASIPQLQHQYMVLEAVTVNQIGGDWPRLHPLL